MRSRPHTVTYRLYDEFSGRYVGSNLTVNVKATTTIEAVTKADALTDVAVRPPIVCRGKTVNDPRPFEVVDQSMINPKNLVSDLPRK